MFQHAQNNLRVKAVIMNPDHTNDILVPTMKKNQFDGKTFKHGNTMYLTHPDFFQITNARPFLFMKRHYTTYYYKRGSPQPLPVPNFPDIPTLGVSDETLKNIFTEWFYRIIANPGSKTLETIHFMITVATALGVGFIIFRMLSGDSSAVGETTTTTTTSSSISVITGR